MSQSWGALATIVLVGVHPELTQTPPSWPRSTSATFWPAFASSAGKDRQGRSIREGSLYAQAARA